MHPLKIGVMVDRITPGATPKFLGREVRHLRELGHDAEGVAIVDSGLPASGPQFEEYLGSIPIRYMSQEHRILQWTDFRVPPFGFLRAFDIAAGYTMGHFLKSDAEPYDLLIAHGSITCWIANKIWRARGIPYLAVLWDPISFILDDVYRKRLPGPVFRAAMQLGVRVDRRLIDDALVTVTGSDWYAQKTKEYTGRTVEPLYPGVEVGETIPDNRGDFLVTLDRWDIGNMPIWLLDVLLGLTKPVKLKVAGFWWPEEMRVEFEKAVAARGLHNQVEILGPVSESQLIELFRTARAMIFPHKAGINFAVMEAAANGCPTVMQEGIDLFIHGETGFFPSSGTGDREPADVLETHRPQDLSAFIRYTEMLVNDERLAWRLGANAWELMKSYSWEYRVKRMESFIDLGLQPQSD
jgi:glycosyltransferase involved in cell wall biosynthesis